MLSDFRESGLVGKTGIEDTHSIDIERLNLWRYVITMPLRVLVRHDPNAWRMLATRAT